MKICVIGGGIMGTNHIRVLKSLGHEVIAIEQSEKRALDLHVQFGINTYSDMEAGKAEQVEAYVVSTPTTSHYLLAKWILFNDPKPMLIEKPVCATIEQAEEIKALAHLNNTLICVGHIERHNPIVKYAKSFLESAKIKLINSYRLGFNNRITDVGVVADLAIHDVDVLSYLAGAKIIEVSASHLVNPNTGHESYGKLFFTFENGVMGSSEVSWVHPEKIRKIEMVVAQEVDQFVTVDYLTQTLSWSSPSSGLLEKESHTHYLRKEESLRLELQDFTNAVQNGTRPLVTIDEGIEALKVIEASYESFKTGKVVKL